MFINEFLLIGKSLEFVLPLSMKEQMMIITVLISADWERYLFIQLEIKDGIIQYIDYNLLD
jgi:hypothetical protein